MFETLFKGMFVTVSLQRYVCYKFSVDIMFVTDSQWRRVCHRFTEEGMFVTVSIEVFLLQIDSL